MKHLCFYGSLVLLLLQAACKNPTGTNNTKSPVSAELQQLNDAIRKDPNNASLYFSRGKWYSGLKMDSMALIDFQQAVKLDSTKSEYFSAIGDILFEHKDVSGSVQWIQKAITLNPNDEVAHLKMAKLFLFTEDYPKAFTEINTVLRSNVYNPEAYFLKGMCYKHMKDTSKAISSFQTAVQTDPKYIDALIQLAIIYEARKDPLALQYYENAYRADSSSVEPLYGQIMFWQNQNRFAEAKKVCLRIIAKDRNYPKSYYNLGWMLLQEDSIEKAKRHFEMALQVKPDYPEAYFNRGLCHEILGDYAAAKADYEQALSFNPDIRPVQEALARLKTKLKQ